MSFTIGRTIGKGGQAEVVRATSNGKEYAIKLFEYDYIFHRELEVMKHNLQGLPKYHCVTKVRNKCLGIVMPVYGIDIRKHIKYYFTKEPRPEWMPEAKVKELGLKMLKWIEQLHSIGYVHCDIKPENFLFASTENTEK